MKPDKLRSRLRYGWTTQRALEEGNTPEPADEPSAEMLLAASKAKRAEAYRAESDPIFFKAQRGEATMQEWLDKVAEIKARFP